jgi:hypothetical protein
MHGFKICRAFVPLAFIVFGPCAGTAQTLNSGSTGADGAFAPTTSVRLSVPPDGVFNFTTIDIPAGVTVSFATRSGVRQPPISLLATGNVVVAGRIDVSGGNGGGGGSGTQLFGNGGVAGPGGYDGGAGSNGLQGASGGAGLGPGGGLPGSATAFPGHAGHLIAAAGVSGGRAYGDARLVPLIGGSGGGGGASQFFGSTGGGGGGGGGALLIASSGTMTLSGTITATGGGGGSSGGPAGGSGSGGAVRLVASTLVGNATIDVNGGPGASPGRIRIEAFTNSATVSGGAIGGVTVGSPEAIMLSAVGLRIGAIAGVRAPVTPAGSYVTPDVVLPAGTTSPVTVALETSQIPLGTTITVTATPLSGAPVFAISTPLVGTPSAATATATLALPTAQPSVISATASFTLAGTQ